MALSTDQYGYLIDPLVPITDATGTTIKDGFLRVYIAGSSTPVITYRNFDGAANEQTIELDNSGRCKYPVIVSKSLAYKVVVYDAQHSQETPIITVDKMFAIGASVTAGAGSTVVQGLDDVEGESDGFVTADVVGTTAKVKLDATNVSHTLTGDAAVSYAANAGYMVPALSNDPDDPGDPQKLPLEWIFRNRLNAVHTKTEISDFEDANDGFLVDSNTGPKFMKWQTLANKVLGFIKSLSTTITSFRTGDVIAVDGPSGTAKMSKDTLLAITANVQKKTIITDVVMGIRSVTSIIIPLYESQKVSFFIPNNAYVQTNAPFTVYPIDENNNVSVTGILGNLGTTLVVTAQERLNGYQVVIGNNRVIGDGSVSIEVTPQSPFDYSIPHETESLSASKVIGLESKMNLRKNVVGKSWKQFVYPSSFDTTKFPKIMTDGYNFRCDFDITTKKNAGGTTYYVSYNGTGDGSTESSPTTIAALVSTNVLSDGDTIIMLDGIYRDTMELRNSNIYTWEHSVNIIAKNKGKAILASKGTSISYSKTAGKTYVYQTTRSNVRKFVQIVDDDINFLTKVTSITEVDSLEGSWFLDGSTLYVHLLGDIIPNNGNCIPLLKYQVAGHPAPLFYVTSQNKNVNLYLEGITMLGGTPCNMWFSNSSTYQGSTLACKDCKFLGAESEAVTYDAVSVLGCDSWFVNCDAGYSSKDGFNYHSNNGVTPIFVEIDCNGYENGNDGYAESAGSTSSNGSTAHDGICGIRIRGNYYHNRGGNIADTTSGTKTLNFGVNAFDSACPHGNWQCDDFGAQSAGVEMWLYACNGFGSEYSAYAYAGATIHSYDSSLETTFGTINYNL